MKKLLLMIILLVMPTTVIAYHITSYNEGVMVRDGYLMYRSILNRPEKTLHILLPMGYTLVQQLRVCSLVKEFTQQGKVFYSLDNGKFDVCEKQYTAEY